MSINTIHGNKSSLNGLETTHNDDTLESLFVIQDLEVEKKQLGDNLYSASSLNILGTSFYANKEFDKAIDYYNEVLKIREEALGKKHLDVARSHHRLGTAHYAKKEYDKAIEHFKQALTIREETLEQNHPDLESSLNNLATAYYANKQYDQALPLFRRVLEFREKKFGKDHPLTVKALKNTQHCMQQHFCKCLIQ